MFLRGGYYGRTAAPVDGVPDGSPAVPAATWTITGLTRTEAGSDNPVQVTLTENTASSEHVTYWNNGPTIGPVIRGRLYLRAGTRRYVQFLPNASTTWTGITIDTQTWTITNQASNLAGVVLSATLTDLGGGDYLAEVIGDCGVTGGNFTAIHGSLVSNNTIWNMTYLGTGATFIVRRVDVENVTVVPVLGAGTVTVAATTGTTLTGTTTHTPAAGVTSAVVRYICRNTVTTSHNPLTATFQSKAVVFPSGSQASNISAASKAFVGVGYVTGLTPGTPGSLAVTSNRTMGQLVARIDDVAMLTAPAIGAAGAVSSVTSSASPAVSATMQAAGSIVLAVVGAVNGGADPFSLSAGWTEQAEEQSGTAATDVAAVFGTKIGGTASTVETMTGTGALATTAWGGAILELKTA